MWGIFLLLGFMSAPGLVNTEVSIAQVQTSVDPYAEKHPLIEGWYSESAPFADLFQKLENDFLRYGQSEKMVRAIFYRSHQQLFHRYKQYTLDLDALNDGLYDCVSGSLILAALLDQFDISYEIVETSFHVFLEVTVEGNHLLLEVTDPRSGLMGMPEEKDRYLSSYAKELGDVRLWQVTDEESANSNPTIYKKISLRNLMGLQYFNQSIRFYNEGNPLAAYQFSVTALKYHNSERIEQFSEFLKQAVTIAAN